VPATDATTVRARPAAVELGSRVGRALLRLRLKLYRFLLRYRP